MFLEGVEQKFEEKYSANPLKGKQRCIKTAQLQMVNKSFLQLSKNFLKTWLITQQEKYIESEKQMGLTGNSDDENQGNQTDLTHDKNNGLSDWNARQVIARRRDEDDDQQSPEKKKAVRKCICRRVPMSKFNEKCRQFDCQHCTKK